LQLGYGGVSAKNCKGVFRTLHSHRVLHEWHARSGAPVILAAEDLTHPGMRALQQDTAVVTALGLGHAERNGHHYVRGLGDLSAAEQAVAARDFAELYERGADGLLRLVIRGGSIATDAINAHAYGGEIEVAFDGVDGVDGVGGVDGLALRPLPLPDPGPDLGPEPDLDLDDPEPGDGG
jgi:hypothetical protein